MRDRTTQTPHGFTLIELLVTLVVVGILISLAIPNFTRFLNRTAVLTACSELSDTLAFAKAEGIARSSEGQDLVYVAPACGDTWSSGWFVFTKAPGAAEFCYRAPSDTLIQRSDPPSRGVAINFSATAGASTAAYVGFNGQGLPRDATSAFVAGTFTCSIAGVPSSSVVLSALGRVRGSNL